MVEAHVRHICNLKITVDASPWRGGAVKYKEVNQKKHCVLGGQIRWNRENREGYVRIRGDAEGVPAALLRKSGKSPGNRIFVCAKFSIVKDDSHLVRIH